MTASKQQDFAAPPSKEEWGGDQQVSENKLFQRSTYVKLNASTMSQRVLLLIGPMRLRLMVLVEFQQARNLDLQLFLELKWSIIQCG